MPLFFQLLLPQVAKKSAWDNLPIGKKKKIKTNPDAKIQVRRAKTLRSGETKVPKTANRIFVNLVSYVRLESSGETSKSELPIL